MSQRHIAVLILLCAMTFAVAQAQEIPPTACPPIQPKQPVELSEFGRGKAYGMAVSPDGTTIGVTGKDGLWLYDAETFAPIRHLEINLVYSPAVSWSPDGYTISLYIDPTVGVGLYDVEADEVSRILPTDDDFMLRIFTLSWSPDSSKLASIGNTPWRVWDVATGEVVKEFSELQTPQHVLYNATQMTDLAEWSPDGSRLALPDGRNVATFETETWVRLATLETDMSWMTSLDWSMQNQLAVSDVAAVVQVWDTESGLLLSELRRNGDHFAAKWSSDGSLLAVGSETDIEIIDVEQQAVIITLGSHLYSIDDLIWTASDQAIISRGEEGSILRWNVESGLLAASLTGYGTRTDQLVFSPDGTKVAAALTEGNGGLYNARTTTLRILDASTLEIVADLLIDTPPVDVNSIAWSSDGQWIAIYVTPNIWAWNISQPEEPVLIEATRAEDNQRDVKPALARLSTSDTTITPEPCPSS